jgi:hypothetical protein
MSADDLEQRYRRVLRVLPGWYRQQWEEDMVAAFLDSWLTGDPEADAYIMKAAGPSGAEVASVATLAARLYLGAVGTPRRYFAWGQAIRGAVLAMLLVQATHGLELIVLTSWSRHLFSWLPAAPAIMAGDFLAPAVQYLAAYAWIASFVALVLGRYRTAQLIAALAIVPDLVFLLRGEFAGGFHGPGMGLGPWAFWVLVNLAPVLAMTAFHRDSPPAERRPWLLALPATYLLAYGPVLVLMATGEFAWMPDFSGLFCLMVALACLAHAPRARSRQSADSGVWSLALMLLAADAGAYRIFSLADYLHAPHLINVGLAELLILVTAVALVARDGARAAQAAAPATPAHPQPG